MYIENTPTPVDGDSIVQGEISRESRAGPSALDRERPLASASSVRGTRRAPRCHRLERIDSRKKRKKRKEKSQKKNDLDVRSERTVYDGAV